MFDDYSICPYTGLRSFTEDESLYFKGREEHIEQATEQLQRNKFLMLTGASGDGKSSLVYAGIVPNARAGFLKSKYTQWSVADFRPERTPFKNLCRALAKQLDIENVGIVESELQHGFSALVDLYKNSKRFIDVDSSEWQQADDAGKAALKRSASNLMIIVDQFEEFFTNPENYHHGIPSRDSNLVLNVLLETARIALEEDLPIYIVFTMRSDYIGQCAAFRSLPEYIGFSQFFVPRLNRSQLQQVIEEPAELSGNRISRRLTERLIHDIAEGVDQLPILQHALNQIWHAADSGQEEMDLIHYAMVGGMAESELPDEQVEKFKTWFSALPEKIKRFYQVPNLQNVLDTHANKLFESAVDSYRTHTGKELSDETAKLIIKKTFTCLTKIDQSRAVRNRMTLGEITRILGNPDLSSEVVGGVLDIFRQPGNTFIRPFITEEATSQHLRESDILDITHESLIRNWDYLETWANEEFTNYTISLDFEQQLARWVESGKSNGFLLSIGPLTYFENWYNKVAPNAYWIARYLPEEVEADAKVVKAQQVLDNAREFIRRSARKHVVTRTFMKYGTKRIAAVFGILAIVVFSSFAYRDYLHKQNAYVLNSVREDALQIASSSKVGLDDKVLLLIEELRLGQITIPDIIRAIDDPIDRVSVMHGIPMALVIHGRDEPRDLILQSMLALDSLLDAYPAGEVNNVKLTGLLNAVNDFAATLNIAIYYNKKEPQLTALQQKNARRAATWALHIADKQPEGINDIYSLAVTLENALNGAALDKSEVQKLIDQLSPFNGEKKNAWHQSLFKFDNIQVRGNYTYGYKFNGLYQELAYLYAAAGNPVLALQCVDSLLKHGNYYLNDYNSMMDNASNIAMVFYLNGQETELDAFVRGYCARKNITEEAFYGALTTRFYNKNAVVLGLHFYPPQDNILNFNTRFVDGTTVSFFFSKYRQAVESTRDIDRKNFQLAMSYKNEGIFKAIFTTGFNDSLDRKSIYPLFEQAFAYYNLVRPEFLIEEGERRLGGDVLRFQMEKFFLYPDFFSTYHPAEPRNNFTFFATDYFMRFLVDKGYVASLYKSEEEIKYIAEWLSNYDDNFFFPEASFNKDIDYGTLKQLEGELVQNNRLGKLDFNSLYFFLGRKSSERKDGDKAYYYYSQIKKENLPGALRLNRDLIKNIAFAITDLIELNHFEDAYALIKTFKNNINRSSLYAFASVELVNAGFDNAMVQQLLDSAREEMSRTKDLTSGQPNRQLLAYALTMEDPIRNKDEAYRIIKNVGGKAFIINRLCRAIAYHGNLYESMQQIPENISLASRAGFLWSLLYGYQEGISDKQSNWDQYTKGHRPWMIKWINYVDDDV